MAGQLAERTRPGGRKLGYISGTFLVDAHVHYYPRFAVDEFFESAARNFDGAKRTLPVEPLVTAFLFLTETPGERFFEYLTDRTNRKIGKHWRVLPTEESCSVRVRGGDGQEMIVVAGRQIASREGLEVLAIGTIVAFRDDMAFPEALAAAMAASELAIVPWGFGKWWFERGAKVQAGATEMRRRWGKVYLGDNSNRLRALKPPKPIRERADHTINLPGSDPLPLSSGVRKPGSCGFAVKGSVSVDRPAADLISLIRQCERQPSVYGRFESLAPFVCNQMALQFSKRVRLSR